MKETLSNIISLSVALGILSFVQEIKTEVLESNKYLVENVSYNPSGVSYNVVGDERIRKSIPYGDFNHHLKDLENGDTLIEHKLAGRNIYNLKMNFYPESIFEIIKN